MTLTHAVNSPDRLQVSRALSQQEMDHRTSIQSQRKLEEELTTTKKELERTKSKVAASISAGTDDKGAQDKLDICMVSSTRSSCI